MEISFWGFMGALGTFLFFLRWLVQAYYTYRRKRSHLPDMFWYLSMAGAVVLIVYAAVHLRDWVFTLTNLAGLVIYLLNLFYLRNEPT